MFPAPKEEVPVPPVSVASTPKPFRVAADVGGTFTDIVAFDEKSGEAYYGKTLTTPEELVKGILTGVDKAGTSVRSTRLFMHGTTVGINTLLERTGAKTALLTTRGFRDVYEIGRINRPESYNLFFRKHVPLIPRALRFEVSERMNAAGGVHVPLDEAELIATAAQLRAEGVQAVAILFLHSYINPDHEIRAKKLIEQHCPGLFVSASHELSKEYREYERTSTVAANAYIGPRIKTYLGQTGRFDSLEQAAAAMLAISAGFGPHTQQEWLDLSRHMVKPFDGDASSLTLHYDPAIAIPVRAATQESSAHGEAVLWQLYDNIQAKTLLTRGASSDLLTRATAAAMAQRGPRAQVVEFAGVGHAPTFVPADQVDCVARFLLG